MKAVILAAGLAARLRPLTDHIPKCLLPIGGKPILERTVENLIDNRISELIIVTGYLETQIRQFIIEKFPSLSVQFILNEDYATTNNIYSLWLTKKYIRDSSILLLDSDIIFDTRIIRKLLDKDAKNCLVVRSDQTLGEEEMKVISNNNGQVLQISKQIDPSLAVGESIGIEKFDPDFIKILFKILDKMILEEKLVDIFYETAFQKAIDSGQKIESVDTGGFRCIEIDTAEDLTHAEKDVIKYINRFK